MKSRLQDVPVLKTLVTTVEAKYFNRVRLGLLRLENQLRFELPRLRSLDLLMDEEIWLCVDRSMNDLPVLAWMDFAIKERQALHEPVRCQLRFFHSHANIIAKTILEDMDKLLAERLTQLSSSYSHTVSPFRHTTI